MVRVEEVISGRLAHDGGGGRPEIEVFNVFFPPEKEARCQVFRKLVLCVVSGRPQVVAWDFNCITGAGNRQRGEEAGSLDHVGELLHNILKRKCQKMFGSKKSGDKSSP